MQISDVSALVAVNADLADRRDLDRQLHGLGSSTVRARVDVIALHGAPFGRFRGYGLPGYTSSDPKRPSQLLWGDRIDWTGAIPDVRRARLLQDRRTQLKCWYVSIMSPGFGWLPADPSDWRSYNRAQVREDNRVVKYCAESGYPVVVVAFAPIASPADPVDRSLLGAFTQENAPWHVYYGRGRNGTEVTVRDIYTTTFGDSSRRPALVLEHQLVGDVANQQRFDRDGTLSL